MFHSCTAVPDSDLHPDIIRAMDLVDKAKPLVAELRAEIDRQESRGRMVPIAVVIVAAQLEKLFEEENEDG
jgi:hypothetical protein